MEKTQDTQSLLNILCLLVEGRTTDIQKSFCQNARKGRAYMLVDESCELHRTGPKPVTSDAAAAGQVIKLLHLTQLPLPGYVSPTLQSHHDLVLKGKIQGYSEKYLK